MTTNSERRARPFYDGLPQHLKDFLDSIEYAPLTDETEVIFVGSQSDEPEEEDVTEGE